MATTVGTSGFGTLLKAGNGASSETFAAIAEVKSITGPSLSMETIEATHHQSPGNYRELLPSFLSAGTISLSVNFLPATAAQTVVTTDFAARTKRNFQLVFPDTSTTTWSFSGYYTGFTPTADVDGILTADIEITVTGAVTIS